MERLVKIPCKLLFVVELQSATASNFEKFDLFSNEVIHCLLYNILIGV